MEAFLDDSNQYINRHYDPYLSLDGVFGDSKERFDSQVLYYPFENEFDLPTISIKLCGS